MDEPDIQEAVSKKAFTHWINQHLKRHIPPYVVNDLYKDLRSGVLILALYEQLTGEHLNYATGNNLGILDYIQNIDLAIHTLEKDGLSLGRIHASDIFEGKNRTINALLWNVILYYEVRKQNPKLWETLLEERRKYSAKMEATGESKEFATPQTTAFPLFPTEMFDFGAPRQFLQDWCNQNISSSFDVDSSNFSRSIKEDTILLNTLLKYLEQIFTKQTRTSHSPVQGPLPVHEGAPDRLDLKEAKCMYERVGEKLGLSTLNFDILVQKFDERSIVTYLIHYFQQYLNFIKKKMNEVATSSKTQHEGSGITDNLDQLLESLKVGVYNLIHQADPAISYIAQKEYLIWCKIMNRNSALYDNVRSLFVSPNGRDVTYLEIWNNLEASWIRLEQIKKAWSAELNDILFNQIYQIYFVGNEQMEDHDLSSRATLTGSRSYDAIPRSSSKDNIKAKNAKLDSLTSRASLESSQDRLGQDLSTNRGLAQPAPSLLNINEVGIDTNDANSASNPGIPDPGKAFKHDKSRHNNIKIDAYRLAAIYQFLMCHAKCKETFDLFNKTLQKYVQSNAEYSPSLLLSHHHPSPVEMSEDGIVCDPQLNENLKSLLTKLKNLVKSIDHSLLLESNKCLDAEWPAIINQLHTAVDDIEVVSNAWDVYKSAYNEGKIWLDNMESAQKITLDDIESHEHLFTEIDKYGSILAANCPQYTAPIFHSSFSQLIERWLVLKSQYERCKTLDQKSWFERTDTSELVGLNRGENKHSFVDTYEDSDGGESVIRSTSYTKKFQESVRDKEVVITKMNERIFLQPVVGTSTPDNQEPLARNVSESTINQQALTPAYQSFFDLESRVNPDASFDLYLQRLKIFLRKCLEALQKFKEDPNTKANAVLQSLVKDKIENIENMLAHLKPSETFELPRIEGKLEEWELFLTRNALSECKVVDVEGMWGKYKKIVDQVALPVGQMLNQLVQLYNKLITTFPYQNMDFNEFKPRMNAFIERYEENVKNSNRFDKSLKSLIAPSTKYTYLMDCVYKYIAKVKDVLQTNLKDSRDSSKKFAIKLDDDIFQKFLTQSESLLLVLSNSQRIDVAQKNSKVKQDWQACQAEINFTTLLNNFKVHESRFNVYIDKALNELNYQTDTFKSGNYELNSILQRNTEYFASQKLLFPIKEDLDNMRDFVEEYQKNLDALKSKGENVYQLLNTDSSLMQLLSTVSGDNKKDLLSFHHQMQADLNADLLKWQSLQSKNTTFIKRLQSAISKRAQFTEKFDEIVGGANTIEADIENLLGYFKFQKDHHDIYNMIQDTKLRLENLLSLVANVEKMLTDRDYIQDVPESMQENDRANFETLQLNLKSLLSYLEGIVVTSDTGDTKSQSKVTQGVGDAFKDSQNTMVKTDSPVESSVKINISAGNEDLNLHKKVKLGISSIDIGELEGYKNEIKIKPFPDTLRGQDLGDKKDRYKTVSFTPLTKPVAEIGRLDNEQSSHYKSSIIMDLHQDKAQNPNSEMGSSSYPTISSSSQNLPNITKQSNLTTLTKHIDPFNKFDDQYHTDSSHQPTLQAQDHHQSQLSSEMNLAKKVDNGENTYSPTTKIPENSGQVPSSGSVNSSPISEPKIIPQGPKTADGTSEILGKDDDKRLKFGKNAGVEAGDQATDSRVPASFKALKKRDLARMSFDDEGHIISTRASFSTDVDSMEPNDMQKGVKSVPINSSATPLFDEISGSYENRDDKNKTKDMEKENKDLVVDKSVVEKKSGKTFSTSEPDDKGVVINVTDFMSPPSKMNMNEPLDKVSSSTEKVFEDGQSDPKRDSRPEGAIVFPKFKEEGTKTDAGIVLCPTTHDAQKVEIDKSLSSEGYSLDTKKTPTLDKKGGFSHDLSPLVTIKLPTDISEIKNGVGDNNDKNVEIRKDGDKIKSDEISTFSYPKVAFQRLKTEGTNEILHKEDDSKLANNVKGGTNDQANDQQVLASLSSEELKKGGSVKSTFGDASQILRTSTSSSKENKDDIMDKGTIESDKTHLSPQTHDNGVVINVTDFMTMPTSTNLDVPQEKLSSSIEKMDERSEPQRDSLPEGAIVFPKFEEEGTKTDAGIVLSPITPEAQKEEKDKVIQIGAFSFNAEKAVTSNCKGNTLQDSMRQPLITTKLAQDNLQMNNTTIERDGSNISDNNKTAGDKEGSIEKTKSFLPDIRPWVGGVKVSNTETYPALPNSNILTKTSQSTTPSQPSTQAVMQSTHATTEQEYLEQAPKSPESPFVKFYHQYPHDTPGSKAHVIDKTEDKLIENDQPEQEESKEPMDEGVKDTITPPNSPDDQSLNTFGTNLNTEAPSNSKAVGGKLHKANRNDVQINKAVPESRDDDLWQLDPLADYNNQHHVHSLIPDLKHASSPREILYEKISTDKNHVDNLYYDGEKIEHALDGSSLAFIKERLHKNDEDLLIQDNISHLRIDKSALLENNDFKTGSQIVSFHKDGKEDMASEDRSNLDNKNLLKNKKHGKKGSNSKQEKNIGEEASGKGILCANVMERKPHHLEETRLRAVAKTEMTPKESSLTQPHKHQSSHEGLKPANSEISTSDIVNVPSQVLENILSYKDLRRDDLHKPHIPTDLIMNETVEMDTTKHHLGDTDRDKLKHEEKVLFKEDMPSDEVDRSKVESDNSLGNKKHGKKGAKSKQEKEIVHEASSAKKPDDLEKKTLKAASKPQTTPKEISLTQSHDDDFHVYHDYHHTYQSSHAGPKATSEMATSDIVNVPSQVLENILSCKDLRSDDLHKPHIPTDPIMNETVEMDTTKHHLGDTDRDELKHEEKVLFKEDMPSDEVDRSKVESDHSLGNKKHGKKGAKSKQEKEIVHEASSAKKPDDLEKKTLKAASKPQTTPKEISLTQSHDDDFQVYHDYHHKHQSSHAGPKATSEMATSDIVNVPSQVLENLLSCKDLRSDDLHKPHIPTDPIMNETVEMDTTKHHLGDTDRDELKHEEKVLFKEDMPSDEVDRSKVESDHSLGNKKHGKKGAKSKQEKEIVHEASSAKKPDDLEKKTLKAASKPQTTPKEASLTQPRDGDFQVYHDYHHTHQSSHAGPKATSEMATSDIVNVPSQVLENILSYKDLRSDDLHKPHIPTDPIMDETVEMDTTKHHVGDTDRDKLKHEKKVLFKEDMPSDEVDRSKVESDHSLGNKKHGKKGAKSKQAKEIVHEAPSAKKPDDLEKTTLKAASQPQTTPKEASLIQPHDGDFQVYHDYHHKHQSSHAGPKATSEMATSDIVNVPSQVLENILSCKDLRSDDLHKPHIPTDPIMDETVEMDTTKHHVGDTDRDKLKHKEKVLFKEDMPSDEVDRSKVESDNSLGNKKHCKKGAKSKQAKEIVHEASSAKKPDDLEKTTLKAASQPQTTPKEASLIQPRDGDFQVYHDYHHKHQSSHAGPKATSEMATSDIVNVPSQVLENILSCKDLRSDDLHKPHIPTDPIMDETVEMDTTKHHVGDTDRDKLKHKEKVLFKEDMPSDEVDRSKVESDNSLGNKKHCKKGAKSKQAKEIVHEASSTKKRDDLEKTTLKVASKPQTTPKEASLTQPRDGDFQVYHDYHHTHQSSHAGPKATSEMATSDIVNVPSQVLENILSYKDLRSDYLHKPHIPTDPIMDETVEMDTTKHHVGDTDRDKLKHEKKVLFKEDMPSDEVDRSKLESDNSLGNKKHGKKGAKSKQAKEIVHEASSAKKPDDLEKTTLKAASKPQTTPKEASLTQPHDGDFQVYHDYHHTHQSSHAGPKATSEMATSDIVNVPSQVLENILSYKDLRSDDLHKPHIPTDPIMDETVEMDTTKHHVGDTDRDKLKHEKKVLFKEDMPSDEVDRSKVESDNSLGNKKHGKKGAKSKQAKEIVYEASSAKKPDDLEKTTLKAASQPQTTPKEASLTQPHDGDFQVYHDYHHKHQGSHAGPKATSEMATSDIVNVPSQVLENILSCKDLRSDYLHKPHIPTDPIMDETVEMDTTKHHVGDTDRDKLKHKEKVLFKENMPSDEVDRSKVESDNSLGNKKHGKKGAKSKQAKEIIHEASSAKNPDDLERTTLKDASKPQTTPKEANLTQPHDDDFQVYHDYHYTHQSSHAGPKATSEMSTSDIVNIPSQVLENILSYKDLRSDDLHKPPIPTDPIIDETVEMDTTKHHVGDTDRDKLKHKEKVLFKEDMPSDEVDRSKVESDNSLGNKKHGKKGAKSKQAKEIIHEASSAKNPDDLERTTLKDASKPQTTPKEANLTQPHDDDFQVYHDYHYTHQSSHAGPKATSEMSTSDIVNIPSQVLENILSYKDLRSDDLHKPPIPTDPIIDETVEMDTTKHHVGDTDRDKLKHKEKVLFKEDMPSDEVDRSKVESDNSLGNKKHCKKGAKSKQAKEIVHEASSAKKRDDLEKTTLKAASKPQTTPKEASLTQPHDDDFHVYHDYHHTYQSSHAGPKATSEMATSDIVNVPSQVLENILSCKDLRSDDLHKPHIPTDPIMDETVEMDTTKHHVGDTDRDKLKHKEKVLFKENMPSDEVDRSKVESDNSLGNKKHGKKGAKSKQAKEIVHEASSAKKPDDLEKTTLKAASKPQTTPKEASLTQPHDGDFQVYHDYHHTHQSSHAGPKATSEMATSDIVNVPSQVLENILSCKDLRSDDLHKPHIPTDPIMDETVEMDTTKHHVGDTDRDKLKHKEKVLFKENMPSDEVDRSKVESDNSLGNKKHGKKGAKSKQAKEIVHEASSAKKPDDLEKTTLKAASKPQTTPKEASLTQPHDDDFHVYHDYHHTYQSSHAGPKATSEMATSDIVNVPSQVLENILSCKDLRSDYLHKPHIPTDPIMDETVEMDTTKHHVGDTDRDKLKHKEKVLFKENMPSDEVDRSKVESDNSLGNKKHGKKGAKSKQAKEIIHEASSAKNPDDLERTTLKDASKPQTTPKEANLTQPHDDDFQVYHDYHYTHQSSHAGPKATSEMSTSDIVNIPSQVLENILSYKDLRSDDLHKPPIPTDPIIDETVEMDTTKHHVGDTDRDKLKHKEKVLFKEDMPSDEVDRSKVESDNSLGNKKHCKKGAKSKQAKEIVHEASSAKKRDDLEKTTLKAASKPQTTPKEASLTQPHDDDFHVYHDYHHTHQSSHAGPKATSEMATSDIVNVPSQVLENILSYKDLRSDDLHKPHIPTDPIMDETVEMDTTKHHVGDTDRDKLKHEKKVLFKEDMPSDEVDRSKVESDNSLGNKKHGKKGAKSKQAKEIVYEASSAKKPDDLEKTTLKAASQPQTTPKEASLTQPHDGDFQVYHDYHHKHQGSHAGPKATSEMATSDIVNVPSQVLENILSCKDLRSDYLHKPHIPTDPIMDETVEMDTTKHHVGDTDRDKLKHKEKVLFKENMPSDEVDRSKVESDNSLGNKKHGKKGAKSKQAKEIVHEASSAKKPDDLEKTTLKAASKPQTTPKEPSLTQPHDGDFQVYHDYHHTHQSSHAGPKATSEMATSDIVNVPSQVLENILSYKDLRSDDLHKPHIPTDPIMDETVEMDTTKHHVGDTDRDKLKHEKKVLFKEDMPSDEVDRSKVESDNSLGNKKHGKKGAKSKQAKEIVYEASSAKKPDDLEKTTLKAASQPQTTPKEASLTQPHDGDFQVYHDYHHKHQGSHAGPKATSEMATSDIVNVPSQVLENILSCKDLRSDYLHKPHIPTDPIMDETVEMDTTKHHVGDTDRDKLKHKEKVLFKENMPSDEVDRSKVESDNSLGNKKHGKKGAKSKQAKEIVHEASSAKNPDDLEKTTLKDASKPQTTPKEASLTQPHDDDFQVYHDYHYTHQSSHAGPKATSEMSTSDIVNIPSQVLENILSYKDLRSDDLHKPPIPTDPIIDATIMMDTTKHHVGDTDRHKTKHEEKNLFKDTPSLEVARVDENIITNLNTQVGSVEFMKHNDVKTQRPTLIKYQKDFNPSTLKSDDKHNSQSNFIDLKANKSNASSQDIVNAFRKHLCAIQNKEQSHMAHTSISPSNQNTSYLLNTTKTIESITNTNKPTNPHFYQNASLADIVKSYRIHLSSISCLNPFSGIIPNLHEDTLKKPESAIDTLIESLKHPHSVTIPFDNTASHLLDADHHKLGESQNPTSKNVNQGLTMAITDNSKVKSECIATSSLSNYDQAQPRPDNIGAFHKLLEDTLTKSNQPVQVPFTKHNLEKLQHILTATEISFLQHLKNTINYSHILQDRSGAQLTLLEDEERKLVTFSDDLFKLEEQLESIDDPSRKDHNSSLLLYVSYLKDKCEQILPMITRDKKHLKELLPRVKDLELTLERGEALLSGTGLNDNATKFDFARLERDFKNLSDTKGLSQLKHELNDYVTVLDPVSATILNDASKKLQAIQTLEDIRNKGITTLPSEYENKDKEGLNESSWIDDLANKFSNLSEKLKTKYAQLQALSSNLDTVIPFVKKCETQNEEIQRWIGVTTNALDDPSKLLNDLVKLMPKIMKEREHLTTLLNDSATACNSICDPSLAITQQLQANITTNQKSLNAIDKVISQIVKRQTTLASLENEIKKESKPLQKKIDDYEKDHYNNKSEFDALLKKSNLNPSDINQMYKLLDAQKKLTEDLQPCDAIISGLDFKIHLAINENKCLDKDVEPLLNQLNLKKKAIIDISKKGWSNLDQLKSKLSLDFAERMKEMNPLTETTKQQLSELENFPLGLISLEAQREKFRKINDNLKRLDALISDASQMYLDTPLLTKVQNGLTGGEDTNEEKVLEQEFSVAGMKHDIEQLRNEMSKFHDRHKVLETKFNDEMKDRQQYLEQLEALETNIVHDTARLHSIDLGEDYDSVLDKLNSGLKPALRSYVDTYGPKLNELEKWATSNPQIMASGDADKKTPLERIRNILVSIYEPTLTWANDRIKDEEVIGKEGETLGLETNFLLDKNIEDLKLLTDFIGKLNMCHKTPKKLSGAKTSPAPNVKSSTKGLKGTTPKSKNDKNIIHGGQMIFKVAPYNLTPFEDDTGFGKDDLYEFTKNFNPKEISNIPEILKFSLAKLNSALEAGSNNDKPPRPSNEENGFNDVFTYLAHLRHMYTLLCQPLVKEIRAFSDRLSTTPSKSDRTLKNLLTELDSYRTKLDAIPAKFDDIEKRLVETLKTYFDSKLGALTTFIMDEVEKTDKTEMPKNFTNMDHLMDLRKHLIGKLKKIATANKVLDVVEKQCDELKIDGHIKSKIEALRALLLRSKTKYEEKLGGAEISVSKYWEASKNLDNFQRRYADFERKYEESNHEESTLKDLKSSLEIFIDDINAFIKAHHDSFDPNATFTFDQMDSLHQKLRDLKSISDTLLLNVLNKIKENGQKNTPEQQRVSKEKDVFSEQSSNSQKPSAPLAPTIFERLTSYLPQTILSAPPVEDVDIKDIFKHEKIHISSSSTPFADNNLLNYDTDDTGFGGSPQPTKMVIFENLDIKRDAPSSPLASPKLPLQINPSKDVAQEKLSGILNLRKSQSHKEKVNYDRIETIQRLLSTPTSPLDLGYNSPPHQLNLEALIIKLLDDTDKIIYEAKLNASLKLWGTAGSPLNLDKNDDVFQFSPETPRNDTLSTSTFHEKYTTIERLTELMGQLKLAMKNIDALEDILTYPRLYEATFTIIQPHNTSSTLKSDLKNKYQELINGEKILLQKINSSDSLIDNPSIKEFEEDMINLRFPSSVTSPPKNSLFGRLLSLKDKLISPKTNNQNGFQSKDLDNSSHNAPDYLIKIKDVNFKDTESPIKEDLSLIESVLKNIEHQVSSSDPDSSDKDLNIIPDSKNSSNTFAEKQIKSAKIGRERKTSNAKARRLHDKQENVPFTQTYIYRVIKASLPLQALLLSLLGLACLLPLCNDDYSCALRNNLLKSMAPTLNYPDGPPPL